MQKRAVEEVLKGSTITEAMSKAGYAPSTASTTGKLTNSDGWKELMELYLPDDLIAKKHKELLEATDKDGIPEYNAIRAGVDMGYKLKGKYAPDKVVTVNLEMTVSEEDLSLAEQLIEHRRSKTSSTPSDGAQAEPMGGEI